MPKSASTFLANTIANLPGFRRSMLTPAWGSREQELCTIQLSHRNHRRHVAQHHLCNSELTQHLITKFRLTPVVLVRDLADCVISLRDHLRNESTDASMAYLSSLAGGFVAPHGLLS